MFIYYPTDSFDVGVLTDDSGLYRFEVKYIVKENELIPAIDMSFNPDLITRIILDPKNSSDRIDVEQYLKINGFNCKIEQSAGSYR